MTRKTKAILQRENDELKAENELLKKELLKKASLFVTDKKWSGKECTYTYVVINGNCIPLDYIVNTANTRMQIFHEPEHYKNLENAIQNGLGKDKTH